MVARQILLFLSLAVPSLAAGQSGDLRTKYVGQSSCKPELQSDRFEIRLDKKQNAHLVTRRLEGKAIAMIVQYKSESDECGVVRDIVQSKASDVSFEPECVDPAVSTAVAIGTRETSASTVSGYAIEAWRIDLQDLKFIRVRGKVECTTRSYSGSDAGEDLATWAKQRVVK